jgi:hypothetical protein
MQADESAVGQSETRARSDGEIQEVRVGNDGSDARYGSTNAACQAVIVMIARYLLPVADSTASGVDLSLCSQKNVLLSPHHTWYLDPSNRASS